MKLRDLVTTGLICASGTAFAGGLFLPGNGAVSTTRAGAAVASADDGEAISMNPAGIAKAKGTIVTVGIAAIDYIMSFQRNGNYPTIADDALPYEGQRYPLMQNKSKPPLGFGPFQPVPLIAIVSDLGGRIPHLHAGFGLYAPNAYPFRDLQTVAGQKFVFNDNPDAPPPPTRYDIMYQEAAVILPSVAVAYSITPKLDVGARFSAGIADLKSTVAIWGALNYQEWVKQDATITLEAKDTFVPTGGFGVAFRPTPNIEIGANYSLPIAIHAKGTAVPVQGPRVELSPGTPAKLFAATDDIVRCAKGGTDAELKACADILLPMTATVGARWKFLDGNGAMRGDIELDVNWEHWGTQCDYVKDPHCFNSSDYHVVVDAAVGTETTPPDMRIPLHESRISHGLRDTYSVRLGGGYAIPVGANTIIARGGLAYETAAAKSGWERVDLDGASRTVIGAGGSYKMHSLSIDAGFGVILEGTRSDSRNCVTTSDQGNQGCGPGGMQQPVTKRTGPDPTFALVTPDAQFEHPVNEGTYKSHYLMFMLGVSTWW
jgi:long-subunit fatty acid transport protein